nr:MAG TPA_asm: hypothetical protein [Bacteriophage sp.]
MKFTVTYIQTFNDYKLVTNNLYFEFYPLFVAILLS